VVRAVWVASVRTGRLKLRLDGKEVEVPVEFKEDVDLLPQQAGK
jgi:hypothetical protein